ncbi:unnamed protein product [Owenia fusiformis]|uniref:Uncharacterized protein n=1 Tax=Owenia fusiformis TaxID=6347 RepID=A0A8J1Y639_OWEFU|nr:unnamed protein product [Owenia fusiformis]
MEDGLIECLLETIDNASKHKLQLVDLTESLNAAKTQVTHSADKSKNEIKKFFEELKVSLHASLDKRQGELISEVSKIENDSLGPLIACQALIETGMVDTTKLLNEGKSLLMAGEDREGLTMFKAKADTKTPTSLPEVPLLSDVACISVDLPGSLIGQMTEAIDECGRVFAKGPVQITDILERPGALLVKWSEPDESCLEAGRYRLQYCYGRSSNDEDCGTVFKDAYIGEGCSYILTGLQCNKQYTLRACCSEAEGDWTPWSLPRVGITSLPHHEWCSGVDGFKLISDNTTLVSRTNKPRIIYSNHDSFICGHSMVFKVLQVAEGDMSEGVEDGHEGLGLSVARVEGASLCQPGTLLVTMQGSIFIDGKEKVTKLPSLTKGSVLTIDTEVLQNNKIRVTIEISNKTVTFDWAIDVSESGTPTIPGLMSMPGQPTPQPNIQLYFAFSCEREGWKILVL